MAIIPKKTAFRLSFRNKIKNKKILKHDFRQTNVGSRHRALVSVKFLQKQKSFERKILTATQPSIATLRLQKIIALKSNSRNQQIQNSSLILFNKKIAWTPMYNVTAPQWCEPGFALPGPFFFASSYLKLNLLRAKTSSKDKNQLFVFEQFQTPANAIKVFEKHKQVRLEKQIFKKEVNPKAMDYFGLQAFGFQKQKLQENQFDPIRISHAYTSNLLFGQYGICFEQHGTLNANYIETIVFDIAKARKKGRVWLRLCCDTPVTARPIEARMGKGKGSISYWETKVRPGQIFFEFAGISYERITEILQNLRKKSSMSLRLVR